MAFQGFTQAASDYLWELAFHNERPWFQEHKEQFLTALKDPFDALAHETRDLVAERHSAGEWSLHVSRIYRDARRLFGRGPYKDHLWFTIWDSAPGRDNPAFWFEVSAASFGYGMGFFDATPAQMEAWRAYIRVNPAEMERFARRLQRQKTFSLRGEDYKRPKGEMGELLNPWYNKRWLDISAREDFGGALLSPELPKLLADGYDWLMDYYRLFQRIAG